ncbi:MAG: hypothetical protein LBC77_03855 [Spirochaetaceae bacterium]|jgi:hypothetical protein|nr:hypothetical protein [Spirochaetaceae bacterium]
MDKAWRDEVEARIHALLENKAWVLERSFIEDDKRDNKKSVIELDLTLPKADIDGLRFNEQKFHAVFEKKKDGWWHSRDILFMSARNTEDDNSLDILAEYLQSEPVQNAFLVALNKEDMNIEIYLPKENEGVKKYNGVDWWYWLADRYSGSASGSSFCDVGGDGHAGDGGATGVGGCAPAFRVMQQHELS